MTWSADMRGTPQLGTWIKALSRWQATKPWRGGDENARPLDNSRRKTHMTIRKLPDESIACRLYRTDVVVFHPDGTVTITPYASMSTSAFAQAVLGGWGCGLGILFTHRLGCLVNISGAGWVRLVEATKFKQREGLLVAWEVLSPTEPFEERVLDKVKARAALKNSRYRDYVAWLRMCDAMGVNISEPLKREHGTSLDHLARGPEGWQVLRWLSRDLESIRHDLYQANDCYSIVEHQVLESYRDLGRMTRSWRR